MILYVMRHGPAEDRSPTGRDFDRRLTQAGAALVERSAGTLLATRGAPVPRIVASPLVRAQQTARIVLARAGESGHGFETSEALSGEKLPLLLVEEAAALSVDTLLVGHQPTVEALVHQLAHDHDPQGVRSALIRGFSTAVIAVLERLEPIEALAGGPGRWKLVSMLDPRRS